MSNQKFTISPEITNYRKELVGSLKDCRFARTSSVKTLSEGFTIYYSPNPISPGEFKPSPIPYVLSDEEEYKKTKNYAKDFIVYTSIPLDVKNEKKVERPLSFHSKNLVEPTFYSGIFSFPATATLCRPDPGYGASERCERI